jgi:hypothetical protein
MDAGLPARALACCDAIADRICPHTFGSENLRPFGQSWRNASARLVPSSHVLGDKLMQALIEGPAPCGNERKYFGVLFNNGEPDYRRSSSSGVSVFERS